MKKNLLMAGIAILSIATLGSCKNTQTTDYTILRSDSLSQATVDEYGLFVDTTASNPYEKACRISETPAGETYYEVWASQDLSSSLFTYSYDVTAHLEEVGNRSKSMTANSLYFYDNLYDEEVSPILTQAYNTTYGIPVRFTDFVPEVQTSLTVTKTTSAAVAAVQDGKKVSFTVVYMPVYVTHYIEAKPKLQSYLFLPIYTAFTSDGKEVVAKDSTYELKETKITTFKTKNLQELIDTEKGTLKN